MLVWMWKKLLKDGRPWQVVTVSTAAVVLIAAGDWKIHAQVPLALLYLLPAAFAGLGLKRWQVPVFGLFCTVMAEGADAFSWSVAQGIPRDTLYFAAYTAAGLYVSEMLAKRRLEQEHLRTVEIEGEARMQAEEQLRLLVATSSIAIVTSDEAGTILQANDAAERMFGSDAIRGNLRGKSLAHYIPALARAPTLSHGRRQLKTMMQCQGMRDDAEPFFADVWFSTYVTAEGRRLTAMIIDSSNDLRDREEANLEQMLNGSRLLVGAVSHEIRNICAAIGLVQQNLLQQRPEMGAYEDFDALRQLTSTLERLASVELSQVKRQASHVKLGSFLRDLRIIAGPALREAGVTVQWEPSEDLPVVWADPQSLLQVFLNLVRNAEAALEDQVAPMLSLKVARSRSMVEIRVTDNGCGVATPELLFHPFRTTPHGDRKFGFGLYLSRAMINSFRGELRYEPGETGTVFVVELLLAETPGAADATMQDAVQADEGMRVA